MTPPPGYFPPPPPPPAWAYPRQRSFAGAIFTTLAVTVFGVSLSINLYILVFAGLSSLGSASTAGLARTETVVSGDLKQKVYQVDVVGLIMDEMTAKVARHLKQAEADPDLKALIIHVDSPGGTVTASDDIHRLLTEFKKRRSIPVVVTQGGLAASGGYYISAAGDRVFASRTTLTGNIGVIMQRFNVSKLMEKWGVEDATIVSSGATFKDAGSMFKPESPADRAYLQDVMDQAFTIFKDVVAQGRGKRLTQNIDQIANGKIYTAADALKLGLVDGTDGREGALAWLKTTHALSNPTLVRLEDQPTLASLLGVKFGGKEGARVEIPQTVVEQLLSPRPLYLWRGE